MMKACDELGSMATISMNRVDPFSSVQCTSSWQCRPCLVRRAVRRCFSLSCRARRKDSPSGHEPHTCGRVTFSARQRGHCDAALPSLRCHGSSFRPRRYPSPRRLPYPTESLSAVVHSELDKEELTYINLFAFGTSLKCCTPTPATGILLQSS